MVEEEFHYAHFDHGKVVGVEGGGLGVGGGRGHLGVVVVVLVVVVELIDCEIVWDRTLSDMGCVLYSWCAWCEIIFG